MPTTPTRLSPVHEAVEHLHPTWGKCDDMPVALHIGDAAAERTAVGRLGLCDASALQRTTLKGAAAAELLQSKSAPVPAKIYEVVELPGGGFVARTGTSEFFIEDGPGGGLAARLSAAAATSSSEVYDVLRQDACLILSGDKAVDVLRETCGYEFHAVNAGTGTNGQHRAWLGPASGSASAVIFTRAVGVSLMVYPRILNGVPVFQMWCDGTYGLYLYETLLEIVREHGGAAIGIAAFFPSLA